MEHLEGDYAEYSLWTVCRYSRFRYYDKCFDDYYKENAEDMERKTVLFDTFLKQIIYTINLNYSYAIDMIDDNVTILEMWQCL